jgi:hypothetical protein
MPGGVDDVADSVDDLVKEARRSVVEQPPRSSEIAAGNVTLEQTYPQHRLEPIKGIGHGRLANTKPRRSRKR